jgi:hypothetical protein
MQSLFSAYLKLGFEHITDLGGYDHILFIVALCAIYRIQAWRQVALLVTAFTIGHSLTLAMAALDVIRFPMKWTEFFIPVTIVLTALYNVVFHKPDEKVNIRNMSYLITLLFGFIHGMGFSGFLRSTLMPGEEGQLITQLFAFNLGVELGQLLIVAIIMLIAYVALNIFKVKEREWNLFISGMAAGPALIMALERIP